MLNRTRSSSLNSTQIERASLRHQVRRLLRTQIITGELEAGTLYTVGDFAERLGVSATPVREALADLEQYGLIRVIRNRGFVVPPLTEHDLDEIFQLRAMLEVAALDDVVDNLNSESLAECQRIVDRCTRCAAKGDVGGFLDADREFHLKLVGSLGNQRLVEIVDRLRDQTRLYGLLKLAPEGLVASAAEHADLLLAISEGDIRAGRKILTRHLEHIRGIWAGRPDTAT